VADQCIGASLIPDSVSGVIYAAHGKRPARRLGQSELDRTVTCLRRVAKYGRQSGVDTGLEADDSRWTDPGSAHGGAHDERAAAQLGRGRQQLPSQTIGASYGDAFLAGYATGIIPSLDVLDSTWVHISRTIQPQEATHALYQEYYREYKPFYLDTAADQHDLAALARA